MPRIKHTFKVISMNYTLCCCLNYPIYAFAYTEVAVSSSCNFVLYKSGGKVTCILNIFIYSLICNRYLVHILWTVKTVVSKFNLGYLTLAPEKEKK